jgi:DNA mismatch endonuclease (patch repair protein)
MAAIRSGDTRPEMLVRKALHAAGLRYRLHAKDLPGRPDLVFPKYRAVLFVHGCFWHKHECTAFRWPTSRAPWWERKLQANRARDQATDILLKAKGWRVGIVWECALKGKNRRMLDDVAQACYEWLRTTKLQFEIAEFGIIQIGNDK